MTAMTPETANRIKQRLFYLHEPHGTSMFAVLDSARDPRVYRAVRTSGLEYDCLFSGTLAPSLRAAAPYVVHITPNDALTDYLVHEGWGHSWGIFLAVQGSLPLVRRHLRTLLRVRTETGKNLFFRYYDPRVMRAFLPTCDSEQLMQMFGPCHRFDMEGPKPDRLVRFRRAPATSGQGLRSWSHAVDESANVTARDD